MRGKWPVVECDECGWRVWREQGWTRREASQAYWDHLRAEHPVYGWE